MRALNLLQKNPNLIHLRSAASPGEQLQSEIATLQRNRTLAVWYDHSILQTGYILFAKWVIYDPAVFFTENEYKAKTGKNITNLQGIIEEPAIYMIAPSSSSPTDQLALVGDRLERLQELSKPTVASNGVEIHDQLRFFCGDKPAQQFKRGMQLGGTYKCASSYPCWEAWQCTWLLETTRRVESLGTPRGA